MIVTRTPLRISFAGGGTDFAEFYEKEYGAVLSSTIDKYVYVTLKKHGDLFDEPIRLNYSETEMAKSLDAVKNDIARECLRLLKVDPPIYISTVSDVPAASGLGSSSAFCVGLLNALHAYRGERVSAGHLAEEAAQVEIKILKRSIGKQDHYAASCGGFNFFRFLPGGGVSMEPQRFMDDGENTLFSHVMMFWTEITRDAHDVLSEQKKNTKGNMKELKMMRDDAHQLQSLITDGMDPLKFGQVMDRSWGLKRKLASTITNPQIDEWYQKAMKAGAFGGKLCGAGGGGFLLFIVPPKARAQVRKALKGLSELPVKAEPRGSHILTPRPG